MENEPTLAASQTGGASGAGELVEFIGRRVGNFVIQKHLAHGGMAEVFTARHPALGREVAVKFLGDEFHGNPQVTERFLQEARITSSLVHPNIIEIFDFGELDSRSYYTMELLDGRELSHLLAERGPFPHKEVTEYLQQICGALQAAHDVGVVHRDLKPPNIFVLDTQPPRLKLMDFGVARIDDGRAPRSTRHGQVLGTPTHISPEQALGQMDKVGPASDLYSLGVIAYEMLSGQLPFNSDSDVLTMTMHIKDPVPPLKELVASVPPRYAEVVESCLAKDPKDRPASARMLAARLATASNIAERALISLPRPVERAGRPESPVPNTTAAPAAPVEAPVQETAPETQAVSIPPLRSELTDEPVSLPETVELSEGDGKVLGQLLQRIQSRGDFPSFLNNMSEITLRADANGRFSAGQLSESILKDFALTAKLLRIVNMSFVNRFGGKVYSVNQAVVILGFDSVCSLALGVSVFKLPGNRGSKKHKLVKGAFSDEVAESAVNSLISGEIARNLAAAAGLGKVAELAMMCAMFRNLGQHLVMQYLPDEYQAILTLMKQEDLSLHRASERVLGASLQKLSIGVAEHWLLPEPIRLAMSTNLPEGAALPRNEDKLSALAKFSSDLCEIITRRGRQTWAASLERLMKKNTQLLSLNDKELSALLGLVCKLFETRYAALFGRYSKKNRFLNNAREITGESAPVHDEPALPLTEAELAQLADRTADLAQRFADHAEPGALLEDAMTLLGEALKTQRLVLLTMTPNRKTLEVRAARGHKVEELSRELSLPMNRGVDVFSNAIQTGKSVVVDDALAPRNARRVPQRYYETVGSPAFGLYVCVCMGYPTALLMVDADFVHQLPTQHRVSATAPLRELTTKLAGRSCVPGY